MSNENLTILEAIDRVLTGKDMEFVAFVSSCWGICGIGGSLFRITRYSPRSEWREAEIKYVVFYPHEVVSRRWTVEKLAMEDTSLLERFKEIIR